MHGLASPALHGSNVDSGPILDGLNGFLTMSRYTDLLWFTACLATKHSSSGLYHFETCIGLYGLSALSLISIEYSVCITMSHTILYTVIVGLNVELNSFLVLTQCSIGRIIMRIFLLVGPFFLHFSLKFFARRPMSLVYKGV